MLMHSFSMFSGEQESAYRGGDTGLRFTAPGEKGILESIAYA